VAGPPLAERPPAVVRSPSASGALAAGAPVVPGAPIVAVAPATASSAEGRPDTAADALRAVAELADLVAHRVRPALEAGIVVVCRDFVDAAVVRFGAQAGLDEERIMRLARWATGHTRPDLTLLVDPAPAQHPTTAPAADASDEQGGPPVEPVVNPDPGAGVEGLAEADMAAGDDAAPDAGAEPDTEDEPVDPRRVYQDLAASAPERYLVVLPLEDGRSIPVEVAERIASVLRQRSPARSSPVDQNGADVGAGAGVADDGSHPQTPSPPGDASPGGSHPQTPSPPTNHSPSGDGDSVGASSESMAAASTRRRSAPQSGDTRLG
jgi:thymidylate kinase